MSGGGAFSKFFIRNGPALRLGLAALAIAGTADLFAGMLLESMEEYLLIIPGMMVLIYSAIGMRGNIFGAMGSRIGTAMNIGTFEMSLARGTILRENVVSSMTLTLAMSAAMGVAAWAVAWLFFGAEAGLVWGMVFISSVGGVLAGAVVLCFNIAIAYVGNRREWDVDNITAPLIAAVGDIVTMPMIFVAAWIFTEIDTSGAGGAVLPASAAAIAAALAIMVWRVAAEKSSRRGYSGEAKRIVRQSSPVLLACLVFEIGAGIVIQGEQDRFVAYSVLMVMMPAFLNQGNALSGMLTSRLSSRIHLGTVPPTLRPQREAMDNFAFIMVCAMLTFLYIGLVTYGAAALMGGAGMPLGESLAVIMAAGFAATLALSVLSYYVAIAATRFGLDPDDHCIPITSSVMDLLGSLILVAVVGLVLRTYKNAGT